MKIEIKYSGSILNLPSGVAGCLQDATKTDLQVILLVLSNMEYLTKFEECIPQIASRLTVSALDVQTSLLFWAKHGIIAVEGADDFEAEMVGAKATEAPTYTGKQIIKFVENNKKIQALFNECQSVMGKAFNKADHDNVIKLKEVYRFSDAYIILLLAHCVEVGKTNWAYIRKLANELYDLGITSYKKLESHFADRKNKNSLEYKVRKLLCLGNFEFTAKQKSIFEAWVERAISFELIKYAYEVTVDSGKNPSMPYMARIIENWISSGITTVKEAQDSQQKYREKQAKKNTPSYGDADDFFEAALARSYNKDENK